MSRVVTGLALKRERKCAFPYKTSDRTINLTPGSECRFPALYVSLLLTNRRQTCQTGLPTRVFSVAPFDSFAVLTKFARKTL